MFTLDVRAAASGLATVTNWTMAFVITLAYEPMKVSFWLQQAGSRQCTLLVTEADQLLHQLYSSLFHTVDFTRCSMNVYVVPL